MARENQAEIYEQFNEEAHDFLLKPGVVKASFDAWARDFIDK